MKQMNENLTVKDVIEGAGKLAFKKADELKKAGDTKNRESCMATGSLYTFLLTILPKSLLNISVEDIRKATEKDVETTCSNFLELAQKAVESEVESYK